MSEPHTRKFTQSRFSRSVPGENRDSTAARKSAIFTKFTKHRNLAKMPQFCQKSPQKVYFAGKSCTFWYTCALDFWKPSLFMKFFCHFRAYLLKICRYFCSAFFTKFCRKFEDFSPQFSPGTGRCNSVHKIQIRPVTHNTWADNQQSMFIHWKFQRFGRRPSSGINDAQMKSESRSIKQKLTWSKRWIIRTSSNKLVGTEGC